MNLVVEAPSWGSASVDESLASADGSANAEMATQEQQKK